MINRKKNTILNEENEQCWTIFKFLKINLFFMIKILSSYFQIIDKK